MNLGQKKKIAILISRGSAEYQYMLLRRLVSKARECGYYALVYSCFGKYGNNEAYDVGESYIADLPDFSQMDGIVLAIDTFENKAVADKIGNEISKLWIGLIEPSSVSDTICNVFKLFRVDVVEVAENGIFKDFAVKF